MALSDLAVFTDSTWTTVTEILDQQVNLFNSASQGAIVLTSRPFAGDFDESSFFPFLSGLVRRRDPYSMGAIGSKSLRNVIETMVKVGAGTPVMDLTPSQFRWIQQNPEEAAAQFSLQLAPQILADMLGTAIRSTYAAMSNVPSMITDVSAAAAPTDLLTLPNLNSASAKMGDRYNELVAWVMHSKNLFDLFGSNLANGASLFTFGTVAIRADHLGRPFVVSDQPDLIISGTPNKYAVLGLTAGAVTLMNQNDYDEVTVNKTGQENIVREMQAEWSYAVSVKGFTWDKANGGHAPTNAALATASNWDKIVTSDRDTAGVVLKTH